VAALSQVTPIGSSPCASLCLRWQTRAAADPVPAGRLFAIDQRHALHDLRKASRGCRYSLEYFERSPLRLSTADPDLRKTQIVRDLIPAGLEASTGRLSGALTAAVPASLQQLIETAGKRQRWAVASQRNTTRVTAGQAPAGQPACSRVRLQAVQCRSTCPAPGIAVRSRLSPMNADRCLEHAPWWRWHGKLALRSVCPWAFWISRAALAARCLPVVSRSRRSRAWRSSGCMITVPLVRPGASRRSSPSPSMPAGPCAGVRFTGLTLVPQAEGAAMALGSTAASASGVWQLPLAPAVLMPGGGPCAHDPWRRSPRRSVLAAWVCSVPFAFATVTRLILQARSRRVMALLAMALSKPSRCLSPPGARCWPWPWQRPLGWPACRRTQPAIGFEGLHRAKLLAGGTAGQQIEDAAPTCADAVDFALVAPRNLPEAVRSARSRLRGSTPAPPASDAISGPLPAQPGLDRGQRVELGQGALPQTLRSRRCSPPGLREQL